MPAGFTDVAVEMFLNETRAETRYRGVEVTYTRLLTRELVRRAHVRIRQPEEAQAIIRGRIITMERVPLVEDENDQIIESSMLATVEVEVVDARTGEPLMTPFKVTRRAAQIIPRPETIQDAIIEVMEELAQDTVIRMQAETFYRSRVQTSSK